MLRHAAIAAALLLAGCANPEPAAFNVGQPGLNVARAAMAAGSPEIALNVSNTALDKNGRDLPAVMSQADALNALGRFDEAEASYPRALVWAPTSVGARSGLGRLRLATDPAQAQMLFLSVLERDPRNKIALNNLGIAYDLQGDHSSTQHVYRQAFGVDPGFRAAEINHALSMALSGRPNDAVQVLRPLADCPDASRRLRHDLAVALVMAGDRSEAARILGTDMLPGDVDLAVKGYGELGL